MRFAKMTKLCFNQNAGSKNKRSSINNNLISEMDEKSGLKQSNDLGYNYDENSENNGEHEDADDADNDDNDDDDDARLFAVDRAIIGLQNGEYDLQLVSAFRCNYFDLRQLTSGVGFKHNRSIFHKVAKFCGLPDNDDNVAYFIYRTYMYNIRGIRDELDYCSCCDGRRDYFPKAIPIDQTGDNSKLKHLKDVTKVAIPMKHFHIDHPFKKKAPLKAPLVEHVPSATASDLTIPSASEDDRFLASNLIISTSSKDAGFRKKLKGSKRSMISDDTDSVLRKGLKGYAESEEKPRLIVKDGRNDNLLTEDKRERLLQGKTVEFTCPECNYTGPTEIHFKFGRMAMATIATMTAFCLIPCAIGASCFKSLRDYEFHCPSCQLLFVISYRKPCFRKLYINPKHKDYLENFIGKGPQLPAFDSNIHVRRSTKTSDKKPKNQNCIQFQFNMNPYFNENHDDDDDDDENHDDNDDDDEDNDDDDDNEDGDDDDDDDNEENNSDNNYYNDFDDYNSDSSYLSDPSLTDFQKAMNRYFYYWARTAKDHV